MSLYCRKGKEDTMAANHKGRLHYEGDEGKPVLGPSLHVCFTSNQFIVNHSEPGLLHKSFISSVHGAGVRIMSCADINKYDIFAPMVQKWRQIITSIVYTIIKAEADLFSHLLAVFSGAGRLLRCRVWCHSVTTGVTLACSSWRVKQR